MTYFITKIIPLNHNTCRNNKQENPGNCCDPNSIYYQWSPCFGKKVGDCTKEKLRCRSEINYFSCKINCYRVHAYDDKKESSLFIVPYINDQVEDRKKEKTEIAGKTDYYVGMMN